MIRLGQPFKSVQAEYMKKNKKTLSKTTFFRWKKDAESILAAGMKKNVCRQSYKRSEIKEEFDRDLIKKIEDSAVDLEGLEGLRDMALELSRNDKVKDKDEIENMSFGDDFCRRIVKEFNLKATSTLATQVVLTPEEREMEIEVSQKYNRSNYLTYYNPFKDLLFFANLKKSYRVFLRKHRQEVDEIEVQPRAPLVEKEKVQAFILSFFQKK